MAPLPRSLALLAGFKLGATPKIPESAGVFQVLGLGGLLFKGV